MKEQRIDLTDKTIKKVAFFLSLSLILASIPAALTTDTFYGMYCGIKNIFFSPCPLVTDYFSLGHLSSAFFNAGLCGMACFLMMYLTKAPCYPSTMAGFFLVIAHGFYGLNFINMWPPVLSILIFCKKTRMKLRDNLDMAMFATAFGPFFSELFFRYTLGRSFRIASYDLSGEGVFISVFVIIFLALAIPAMLPGALKMHKGYNLYNGGLAFGLLGMLLFAFMYKTIGNEPSFTLHVSNQVYEAANHSHRLYVNTFYVIIFLILLAAGWFMNGRSFKGYGELLKDSGHRADFYHKYSPALVLINMAVYGSMVLVYFNIVIAFTKGDGFTGATAGIILAAMTFAGAGQHPLNVWPIFAGYALLSAIVHVLCFLYHMQIPWTLSTQAYMNAAAFATGLCPLTGRYGKKAGIWAGMLSAVICTSTSSIHGGFVLYNGGLTAGITALIMVPCMEYYHTFKNS